MHPNGGDAGLNGETPALAHGSPAPESRSVRARFASLRRDARAYPASLAAARSALTTQHTSFVSQLLQDELTSSPLARLRDVNHVGLRLKALESAGFTNVAQVLNSTPEMLAQHRGIGMVSAKAAVSAATRLKALFWERLYLDSDCLATDDRAAKVRAQAGVVKSLEDIDHSIGHALPLVSELATQGENAATMAGRAWVRAARKARAEAALSAAVVALEALERSGAVGRIAAVANPHAHSFAPLSYGVQIGAVLDTHPPASAEKGLPISLVDWEAARSNGSAPRIRKTHPVMWSTAAAFALFAISGLAHSSASDAPKTVVAVASQTPTASPSSAPSSDLPIATSTPAFDLVDAQTSNGVSEVDNRKIWTTAYAVATTGEPVTASADARDIRTAATIAYVIDGDTMVTTAGDKVRVIGIDAPEHGSCGFTAAAEFAKKNLLDKSVTLIATTSEPDADRYGRVLRYIELLDGSDFGLLQVQEGNAAARYDGYDGYSAHPRQETYHQADDAVAHRCGDENPARTGVVVAAVPEPEPALPAPIAEVPAPATKDPWNMPGPDLDCKDIGKMVRVDPPDYHHLDRDGDGWGCESYG